MKIKMTTSLAGPGELYLPGRTYDVPDELAEQLLRASFAKAVEEEPAEAGQPAKRRETAIRPKRETR